MTLIKTKRCGLVFIILVLCDYVLDCIYKIKLYELLYIYIIYFDRHLRRVYFYS